MAWDAWVDPKQVAHWWGPRGFTITNAQSFCDENEKITRPPMAPTWPEVMKTTVTLAAEGPDKTRVTIKWEVIGDTTPSERETFNKAKLGMSQGWGGSFDKLEEYLAKQ